MPVKRTKDFLTKTLRGMEQESDHGEKPLVVAYDTGNGFPDGEELDMETFYQVLKDYDAVIVHWTEGEHPSREHRYLLYRDAKDINLSGDDMEIVRTRKRSTEIKGDFPWFAHGQERAVNLAIGLRCRHTPTWNELP